LTNINQVLKRVKKRAFVLISRRAKIRDRVGVVTSDSTHTHMIETNMLINELCILYIKLLS